MKHSKSLRTLALGFVLGAACMVTVSVTGASKTVSAIINDNLFFNINGTFAAAPTEYPILNYNSRIYVPIRYVAEKLNCDVKWDDVSKTVTVRGAEPEVKTVEVEKEVIKEVIVYVSDDNAEGNIVYKKLPATYKDMYIEAELMGVTRSSLDSNTKVFLNIENRTNDTIQLVQDGSVLTVDGEKYEMSSMAGWWDNTWYNNISDDEDGTEGFFLFDLIPEDWSTASFKTRIRISNSDGTYKYEDFQINFKK